MAVRNKANDEAKTKTPGFRMTAAERAAGEAYIDQLFAERDALPEGSPERLAVADKIFVFTISGGRLR
jgi:hypothetical protein